MNFAVKQENKQTFTNKIYVNICNVYMHIKTCSRHSRKLAYAQSI